MKDIVEVYGEVMIQTAAIIMGLGLLSLCCISYKDTITQVLNSIFYR